MGYLILVRHGKSEWNDKGLWTGWEDPELHEHGREDAKRAAESIKDLDIHISYSSGLKRVTETLKIIKDHLDLHHIPHAEHQALNERHYGIYQGKNKWEIKDQVGEEEFQKIRRSWNHPIPEGETMEQVYNRVTPYFYEVIMPELKAGKNVLVASSGNALRAIVKDLDQISHEDISNLEIGVGDVLVYEIDQDGKVKSKELRSENASKGKI